MDIVIFDGQNAIHRLFHKLPLLTTSKGAPVQLVYGFLRLVHSNLVKFEAEAAVVCWDKGIPRLRTEMWEGYKKKRIEGRTPDDNKHRSHMDKQIEMIQDLIPRLGMSQISADGVEADDFIAMSCRVLEGRKIIVSSDQDMLQLVNENVSVYSPVKLQEFNHRNFYKHFGLSPRQYLEMRALSGDSSDGIPGIAKGLGEKTVTELLQKHGSIKELYKPGVKKKLAGRDRRYSLLYSEGAEERAQLNLKLMDLHLMSSPKAEMKLVDMVTSPKKVDIYAVKNYLSENEFTSLNEKFMEWVMPFRMLEIKK